MSFLTPLYLLAGLAISLPIIFHMIRRTPQGRQVFSSLMFLTPSLSRMTRRSRIEDWLLLILRSLAVGLLAFAFARPFLRAQADVPDDARSRRIAVLLDTSASMRRDGYWERATRELLDVVEQLDPRDSFSLITFDSQLHPLLSFEDWRGLAPGARMQAVRDKQEHLQPGWESTAAGAALIFGAEQLETETESSGTEKSLVLISDLQAGAGWEALHTVVWPEEVVVRLIRIGGTAPETNASLQAVHSDTLDDGVQRIRVSNAPNSAWESFQIGWADDSEVGSHSANVYIPPGESRVVQVPPATSGHTPQRLVLTGDDVEFDNACFIAHSEPRRVRIVYFGPNEKTSPTELRFFLTPMFPSTTTRQVEILDWASEALQPDISSDEISLLIIGGELNPEQLTWTRKWTAAGGQVLFVARNPQQALSLYDLLTLPPVEVAEAEIPDYAMLGHVDLAHPVLRMFDDPRFSDFTKLRFWHYRRFNGETLPGLKVLAAFEDGSPALAELPVGQGRIVLLASGWDREDSDLAVWSKFVPLMNGLLEYVAKGPGETRQARVGETFSLAALDLNSEQVAIRIGDKTFQLPRNETLRFDQPGIYRFAESEALLDSDHAVRVAVNLNPQESRTEPLSVEVLESAGIRLQDPTVNRVELQEQQQAQQRQLMNQELEAKQQIWRWLLVSALGILLLETALAGWRGRTRVAIPEGN